VTSRLLIIPTAQCIYAQRDQVAPTMAQTKHPNTADSYSKCNAEFARSGLSSPGSTDSIRTSFLFLSPHYISLHKNVAGPRKFRRNGPSDETPAENRSYRPKNLAIFDQNLAVFGRWKGAVPTSRINHRRCNSYGNWTSLTPFISFHLPSENETGVPPEMQSTPSSSIIYTLYFLVFVSPCLVLSHSCVLDRSFSLRKEDSLSQTATRIPGCLVLHGPAMGVAQDCAFKSIDTTFTALCFLGALHFLAAKAGSTSVFCKNSTVAGCGRRNRPLPGHEPQKWGEPGGQTAKNEENMQEVTAPKL
jgi:hypothetical protein